MKKTVQILAFALAMAGVTEGVSANAFKKGAFYPGVAAGLSSGIGNSGVALILNGEYGVTDNIGIGGSVGYWSYSEDLSGAGYTAKYKYSIIPIVATGAWHFNIGSPKLDLGAGIAIGYYLVNSSYETNVSGVSVAAASSSGVAIGAFGLIRYFVTESIALRGKAGYGVTLLEAGVDFRF